MRRSFRRVGPFPIAQPLTKTYGILDRLQPFPVGELFRLYS